MSVHLSAPLSGLTLADLYRLVDLARAAGLDPDTPVQQVGDGANAVLSTSVSAAETSETPTDLGATMGEVVGELRRRFGAP
ncbi:MAG TPA: hypothetical protein VHC49_21025 [Mycobacteriales bacterium]|nr:hypothetical protein [Mycobacteriales bacterium]